MEPLKKLIRQCEVKTNESGSFLLKYYILSKMAENCLYAESSESILYGISIKKEAILSNGPVCLEEESIIGFSYCEEEALLQINLLADMLVTPVSLFYVTDDYFSKM